MAAKAKLLMPTLGRGWAVALAVLFLFISFSLPVFAEVYVESVVVSPQNPSLQGTLTCDAVFCSTPPTPVSRWAGEGNANDAQGINNGIMRGGDSYTSGIYGQAFSFNGNNYISIPDSQSLRIRNEITIAGWIKLSSVQNDYAIITYRGSHLGWPWFLGFYPRSSTQVQFSYYSPERNRYQVDADIPSTLGNWVYIAATSGADGMKIYANGELVRSNKDHATLIDSSENMYIGGTGGSWANMNGMIDDFIIFNSALKPEEIKALYANGFSKRCGAAADDSVNYAWYANDQKISLGKTVGLERFFGGENLSCSAIPIQGSWKGIEKISSPVSLPSQSPPNIKLPVEYLNFTDWLAPSGTFEWGGGFWNGYPNWHYGIQSVYAYEHYWINEDGYNNHGWSGRAISPEKVEADRTYQTSSHIYYRVLVKPDGSEQILDQYYFRGDQPTRSVGENTEGFCANEKKESKDGTIRNAYQTIVGCPMIHYYNERTLPQKSTDLTQAGKYKLELRHIQIPGITGRLYNSLGPDSVIDIYNGSPQTIFSSGTFCKNKVCYQDEQKKVDSYPCAGSITWMEESVGSVCGGNNRDWQCVSSGRVASYDRMVKCYRMDLQQKSAKLSTFAKTEKVYDFTITKLATIKSVSILPSIPLVGEILECDVDADGYTEVVWFVNGKDVARGGNLNPDLFKSGDKILCSATPVAGSRRGTAFDSKEVVALSMPVVNSVSISPNNPEEGDKLKCEASATGPTEINWYVNENWISDGENLQAEKTKSGDKIICSATPFVGSRFGDEVVSKEVTVENGSAAAISPFALAAGNGESKNNDGKNNTAPLLAVASMGAIALAGAGALILRRGAAVQPTKPQRIKYSNPLGEIKLNLVKNEIKTYTTNFLENVQARFAEMRETSMRLRNWFEGKQRQHEMEMQTERQNARAEFAATEELKMSELQWTENLGNKQAAALADMRYEKSLKARAESGGIPLIKIGNDFFRKDTGEFWSSVLPTLPRTPVELPPPQDMPGRSGPRILKTDSKVYVVSKEVAPVVVVGRMESSSQHSSLQNHALYGQPQIPPSLDQSRTITNDEIIYINYENQNRQLSCGSIDHDGALLNVAGGGVITSDMLLRGTTHNLRIRANRLYGQTNVYTVEANGLADWVSANGGPSGSNIPKRGFYNSGIQGGRSTLRTANKIDNLLRVGGKLLHALPILGGLVNGFDAYREAKERGADDGGALYAGGATTIATAVTDLPISPTTGWDTFWGIASFGFSAHGLVTGSEESFQRAEKIDSITFSTNVKNVYVNQVTPRGYVPRREEELCEI